MDHNVHIVAFATKSRSTLRIDYEVITHDRKYCNNIAWCSHCDKRLLSEHKTTDSEDTENN